MLIINLLKKHFLFVCQWTKHFN